MTYTEMQIQRYMYDIYRQEVKDMQEYRKLQERTNEELVREYQTTHDEDLFRAVLEKNTGLLHIIVMDYRIPKYEIEDLLSESYIALIKVVDNFDPTRGVTFTTALKVFVVEKTQLVKDRYRCGNKCTPCKNTGAALY